MFDKPWTLADHSMATTYHGIHAMISHARAEGNLPLVKNLEIIIRYFQEENAMNSHQFHLVNRAYG